MVEIMFYNEKATANYSGSSIRVMVNFAEAIAAAMPPQKIGVTLACCRRTSHPCNARCGNFPSSATATLPIAEFIRNNRQNYPFLHLFCGSFFIYQTSSSLNGGDTPLKPVFSPLMAAIPL
jgi:hypothetical protein